MPCLLKTVTPTDEYMQVYDGAGKKLEELGLVF
jgi:methylamine--corrinoid protein Co-methyltransferase